MTEAEVVNKLFSAEDSRLTPDQIFDGQETTVCDPEASVRALEELTAHVRAPQEKLRSV